MMNNLLSVQSLHNRYFAMRHGESKANLQGIIVSHPHNGIKDDFGLSILGRKQAKEAALCLEITSNILIYCSDFSRAKETARIVQQIVGATDIHMTKELRERYFGGWEETSHTNYRAIWALDQVNTEHSDNNVETVDAVLSRATGLIMTLEKLYKDKNIVLISHGDILQILQCGFEKIDPSQHRSLSHLDTAEIRELKIATKKETM